LIGQVDCDFKGTMCTKCYVDKRHRDVETGKNVLFGNGMLGGPEVKGQKWHNYETRENL